VEDLIGIGVSDPAEDPGIGQRPLQRVVSPREGRAKGRERRFQHLEPTRVEATERGLASGDGKRRASLRAGFCQEERAGRKIEGGQAQPPWDLRSGAPPVETAGDHQMKNDEHLVLKNEDDPLSEAAERNHRPAVRLLDGGIDRSQDEGTRETDSLDRVAGNARLE